MEYDVRYSSRAHVTVRYGVFLSDIRNKTLHVFVVSASHITNLALSISAVLCID